MRISRLRRASAAKVSAGISGKACGSFGPGSRVALSVVAPHHDDAADAGLEQRRDMTGHHAAEREAGDGERLVGWQQLFFIAVSTQCVTDQTSRTSFGGSLSPRPGMSAA